jgi:hypothetical protein
MKSCYQFPLETTRIMNAEKQPATGVKESVKAFIRVLLKTHLTEYRYDDTLGCYMWDQDFENIKSVCLWENELENQVSDLIRRNEVRLQQGRFRVTVEKNVAHNHLPVGQRLLHRINIRVHGRLPRTGEKFTQQEYIYFSPLTI